MKKLKWFCRILCALLVFVLLGNTYFVSAEQETNNSILNGCNGLDAVNPLLGTNAHSNLQSAILYEVNTQTLLYAYNPDERMEPSSLAKLVTAIIAIEQADLSEMAVADQLTLDVLPWDAVSVNIQGGEQMSVQDLLYCMLVGSANDAAVVVATHMDGSMAKFAERMNAFAASIGCTNTNFTNSHGLYDPDQYTTARDMAKVLTYASQNEAFAKIIATKDYSVAPTNMKGERNLSSNNYLINRSVMSLYYDSRVTGGRTGVASDGTRCLAATAQKGNMNLVSVVMGCRNVYGSGGSISTFGGFPETTALLDKGFQGLRAAQIFSKNQVLKQYPLAGSDSNLYVGVHDAFNSVLPNGIETDDLRYVYHESGTLAAPIEKGTPWGTVDVYYGSVCIASAPIFALNKVTVLENKLVTEREQAEVSRGSIGIILAIIAAVFVILLLLLRYSKKFRRIVGRKRRKRRQW